MHTSLHNLLLDGGWKEEHPAAAAARAAVAARNGGARPPGPLLPVLHEALRETEGVTCGRCPPGTRPVQPFAFSLFRTKMTTYPYIHIKLG